MLPGSCTLFCQGWIQGAHWQWFTGIELMPEVKSTAAITDPAAQNN